jgi:hypothetical protein
MKLPNFRAMLWVFPVAVALHDGEEAWLLPGWVSRHREQLPVHPGDGPIWAGLVMVTLAAFVVTVCCARNGRESTWAYILFGLMSAMLLNVFVPHVPATVVFRQYTPGVLSAVLLNLPLMSVLLYKAVGDGWVSGAKAVRYALLVPLVLAGTIGALFAAA